MINRKGYREAGITEGGNDDEEEDQKQKQWLKNLSNLFTLFFILFF